jgi:PII-like signaling protein
VNDDCLKLTTYFGERQRVHGRFLAEAQLDLFEKGRIAASVLLRGAEGFGLKHHLRSDRLLSLSEDLPLVSVAVDTRPRIDAVLDELRAVQHTGLVTLERARMLRGDLGPVVLPEELHEATKLTIYVGRQERVYRVPAFVAVCDLLHRRGVAGATVLLGVDGTAHGERRRARFLATNADVPMMIIAVGSGERIGRVLPELGALLRRPMITLERVRVCKRDGELVERPHALPSTDGHGMAMWQKLMIFTSEGALHDGQPVHRAIVQRLRRSGARGATALRGIWGFAGNQRPHGDRLLQLGRRVPVLTVVIDSPERIAASFTLIDELTHDHGVVSSEMVPALTAVSGTARHGGLRLARHPY